MQQMRRLKSSNELVVSNDPSFRLRALDPQDDPITLGLVNMQVASSLLEYFMGRINPYISQLDPVLHSLTSLRKSPFLLTAVLAVAAKAFESALHPDLHAHAERLYADCFRRGEKSTDPSFKPFFS